MPRSVPDNDLMEKQQAADRKPARKSTTSKATAKLKQDTKAKKAAKARAGASGTRIAKPTSDSSSAKTKAGGAKRAPRKNASPDRARQSKAANESLREEARSTGRSREASAKTIESDARANRGLGRLFSFFRRSRG
ncbi:MAG: hypothetical protein WDZ83_17985 [Rhizobiaceae bacterium]